MPQLARNYMASLRRRDALALEPLGGGSYADRHLADTGHPLERGCCALPANKCAGCHKTLPRIAKVKGETYCSRTCREASQQS